MSERPRFTIGLFGSLAILASLLIFLWVQTFQDPDLIYPLVTASFFLIGGLTLSWTLVGVRIEPFRISGLVRMVISTVVNVLVIRYVNQLVPLTFEFSIVDPQVFSVLIGVAEECFFRVFLCGLFYRMTNNAFIAIVGSSAIWANYHVARYGGSMNVLVMIFLCGCVLGASFIFTRSGDGALLGHGVVNYLAYV